MSEIIVIITAKAALIGLHYIIYESISVCCQHSRFHIIIFKTASNKCQVLHFSIFWVLLFNDSRFNRALTIFHTWYTQHNEQQLLHVNGNNSGCFKFLVMIHTQCFNFNFISRTIDIKRRSRVQKWRISGKLKIETPKEDFLCKVHPIWYPSI